MSQRQLQANSLSGVLAFTGPLQKQTRQFFRYRMRQAQGPNQFVSVLAIRTQVLGRMQASVTVLLQEAKKILALDEIQLTGLQSLCGQLVRLAGNCGVQAQNFTGIGNPENECLPVAIGRRKLYPTGANHVNAA